MSATAHHLTPPRAASSSAEEISLKEIPANQQKISTIDSPPLSIGLPPSDPPHASSPDHPPKMSPSMSPPAYYMPNSPTEMFLVYEDGQKKGIKGKKRHKEEEEGGGLDGKEQNDDVADEESGQHKNEEERDRLNRRQTRLYRTLVWAQFSMTLFTCIFIMVIMVLVAVILVMLQRTIDRADHAIRDNPVSLVYTKLKNAVNRINI